MTEPVCELDSELVIAASEPAAALVVPPGRNNRRSPVIPACSASVLSTSSRPLSSGSADQIVKSVPIDSVRS